MNRHSVDPEKYGAPNSNAPKELSQFAFLIGTWRGEGRELNDDGSNPYRMQWVGRYILDGYAIADEARVFDQKGELENLFITYRFYDRDRKKWIIECLNVMESTMIHKSPEDPGEVKVSEASVELMLRWPARPNAIGRELFIKRNEDHFTYRLDVSTDDGMTWMEALDVIETHRIAE